MKWLKYAFLIACLFFCFFVVSSFFDYFYFYEHYVAKAARLTGTNIYLLKAFGVLLFVPFVLGIRWVFNPFSALMRRRGYITTCSVIAVYNLTFFVLTHNQNFAVSSGKGLRWFSIRDGTVQYFDQEGVDPVTGVQLQPVTPENAAQLKRWERGELARIEPKDGHFFNTITGESLFWCSKSTDGSYEFFDGPGFHPTTRAKLQSVTPEIVEEWQRAVSVRQSTSRLQAASTPIAVVATTSLPSPNQAVAVAKPPPRKPERTWDRPHIYLQIANELQRKAATELRQRLVKTGYAVVSIDNASGNDDIPTQSSELRFFTSTDSAEAQRIIKEVASFFGETGIYADLPEGMPYVSHARQYEIWFSYAFR